VTDAKRNQGFALCSGSDEAGARQAVSDSDLSVQYRPVLCDRPKTEVQKEMKEGGNAKVRMCSVPEQEAGQRVDKDPDDVVRGVSIMA
jgi:hypothetical protein